MAVKTLKVYKTEKSKRSNEVTSVFKLFDDDVVNGRIRVFDTELNIYWINVSDWTEVTTEVIPETTIEREIIHHTVKWGENVEQIARKYGVDCNLLYARYPNKLAAGMTITIVK